MKFTTWRNTLRKKGEFSVLETDTIATGVDRNGVVLFGNQTGGVNGVRETLYARKITAAVGSTDVTNQTMAEFKI